MIILIVLLTLFSCFSLSTIKNNDNEIIKTALSSESDPTDEEIINYCINLIKTDPGHKNEASTYLDLFYGTDFSFKDVGSIYFGDLNVSYDEVMSDNYYEFNFIADTITFKKDSIYLINNFTDGNKGTYEELSFLTLFKAAYNIKWDDYFRLSAFNCDTFCDGDFDYPFLPQIEQNILQIMNNNLNDMFEDNYFERESLVIYPKKTFTVTRVSTPDLSASYTTYKFYGHDDPNKTKYNYEDFGFKIYEFNRIPNDIYVSFNNPTFLINADSLISFDDIKAQITASDLTEGDVTDKIVFKNNTYLPVNGKIKPGIYSFTAEVTDTSGNMASKKFNIEVRDITAPTVTTTDVNIEYYEKITEEELKTRFTPTDNCDDMGDIIVSIIKDDYFKAQSYKTFKASCGTYETKLRYTDTSGNSIDKTFNIIVDDHIKPIITIKEPIVSYTKNPLSISGIKKNISAIDEYDGELSIILDNIDKYGTNKEIKEYNFKAKAVDKKGNETEVEFTVSLVDNDVPEIDYKTSYLIVVDENDKLTKDMILDLLKTDVDLTNFKVVSVESSYLSSNNIKSGSYDVIITGVDLTTQEVKTINAEIRVPEKEKEVIAPKKDKNITDFIKENSLFFYLMVVISIISLISLIIVLIKNLKKYKKHI